MLPSPPPFCRVTLFFCPETPDIGQDIPSLLLRQCLLKGCHRSPRSPPGDRIKELFIRLCNNSLVRKTSRPWIKRHRRRSIPLPFFAMTSNTNTLIHLLPCRCIPLHLGKGNSRHSQDKDDHRQGKNLLYHFYPPLYASLIEAPCSKLQGIFEM